MRIYKKPHESSKYSGFYQSPIPGILISKKGLIRNSKTGEILPTPMSGEYPGIFKTHVHRLMARTFLKCPGPENEYQVNHIDGDKLNTELENLEWATHSQNALHAYISGLRPDNKPIFIKDLETGNITEHYSISEGSRYIGLNPAVLSKYLKSKQTTPFHYKWTACLKGNAMPCLDRNDLYKVQSGVPRPYIVKCIKSNTYMLVKGTKELARYLNLPPIDLINLLIDNKIYLKGVIIIDPREYTGKFDDLIKIGFKTGNTIVSKPPKKILVENINTGEKKIWNSTEDFSEHLGVKKNTMQKAMLVNDGKFMNYKITYRR